MIKVSVIVPAYKRIEQTLKTLRLIEASDREVDIQLEIIVADSSPDDILKEAIFKEFEARILYIRPTKQGIATNKNEGARNASGNILIFCDSDIEVESDTLAKTIEYLKKNKYAGAVGSQVLWKGGVNDGINDRPRKEDRMFDVANYKAIEAIYSRYIATYKDIFWKVGGYDEEVFNMRGEGSDLSIRYWREGYPLFYDQNIIVHHVWDAPNSIALRVSHPEWGIAKDLILLAYKYNIFGDGHNNFVNTVYANFASFKNEGYYNIIQGIANNLDEIVKAQPLIDKQKESMHAKYPFKFLEVFSDEKLLHECLKASEKKLVEVRKKAFG